MRFHWIGFSILVLCLVSPPSQAGVGAGNGELGFSFGYADLDSEVSSDSGTTFDFRGGYHFTRLFQLEGQLSGVAAEELGVDIAMASFLVNAVFNFHPTEEIVPYVLAGIGQTNLEYDLGLVTIDDDGGAYQVAVGSRFFVGRSKRMAVRVEIASLREETFDESSQHTLYAVGLTWRLGRGK